MNDLIWVSPTCPEQPLYRGRRKSFSGKGLEQSGIIEIIGTKMGKCKCEDVAYTICGGRLGT